MRNFILLFLPMLAFIAASTAAVPAQATGNGVQDNAQLFKSSTVESANDLIRQIRTSDHRDVLVVTYPSVPEARQAELASKGKQRFFSEWAEDIGRENRTSGVVILIIKDPGHLEIAVGNKTSQGIFTLDDRKELEERMLKHLREKTDSRYDDALLDGLQFIKTTMDRHPAKSATAAPNVAPPYSSPPTNYSSPSAAHQFSGVGGLVCLGVGIIAVVFLIMAVANRNRSYGAGYGAPPPGGYPPGYSGPYNQGGGYFGGGGGGGGGGFGRGLLGGLLGGALGAWGYDKFNQGSQSPNYLPPQQPNSAGGYPDNSQDQTDTGYSSTGSDFDSSSNSSPPDSSGGSDFGSGDSGGGGGDFGGGGDSGGGGGDF